MRITFLGAAGEVTGSCSLLEAAEKKYLVDCGMFQGGDFNDAKNHDPLPFDAKTLDAVFVTHAHLDHVGRLPLLVKNGFTGPIYATPATAELAKFILEDALEIMEYDHKKFAKPVLFDSTDIAAVVDQFHPVDYQTPFHPKNAANVTVNFFDSGHIFGASFILFEAEGKRVVFSGDVGNVNVPILKNTVDLPSQLDVVVCESTYGNRLHENAVDRQTVLKNLISEALARGGVLMIPAFSLERTQELLYSLNDLINHQHELQSVPIYLDSPLAIDALSVYRKYPQYYDKEAAALFKDGEDFFQFPNLFMCRTREESKKINQTPGQKIIIAGAGMMNGGRILHHALRYLSDEKSTLLITGYQADGTLGRNILDGHTTVRVFNEQVDVRCAVKFISTLSAHADQHKLVSWIKASEPQQVYLNHGDHDASTALAEHIKSESGVNATPVTKGMSIEV
jgi:metallo-beta-lactamase family protein